MSLAETTHVMDPEAPLRVTGNLFLDHLPDDVRKKFIPLLERVELKHADVVSDYNSTARTVIFPIASIISVVLDMANGEVAEVGLIGREGMSGLGIVLGRSSLPQRLVVQVPDSAESLSAVHFQSFLEREPAFHAYALRYAQATILMGAHLSACNALHSINERCARWLLMAHDRVGQNPVKLTQEYLSQMLGVRRSSVTSAATALQQAGCISYSRGQVSIRNRTTLEALACECYLSQERDFTACTGYSVSLGVRT